MESLLQRMGDLALMSQGLELGVPLDTGVSKDNGDRGINHSQSESNILVEDSAGGNGQKWTPQSTQQSTYSKIELNPVSFFSEVSCNSPVCNLSLG
jgi:hypothetical protein